MCCQTPRLLIHLDSQPASELAPGGLLERLLLICRWCRCRLVMPACQLAPHSSSCPSHHPPDTTHRSCRHHPHSRHGCSCTLLPLLPATTAASGAAAAATRWRWWLCGYESEHLPEQQCEAPKAHTHSPLAASQGHSAEGTPTHLHDGHLKGRKRTGSRHTGGGGVITGAWKCDNRLVWQHIRDCVSSKEV
jgi:hypothetical protein